MTKRTLMQRLLDERPATQSHDTWARLEQRLARRGARGWLLLGGLALAGLAALLLLAPEKRGPPPTDLYLFIARSDRPLSEGLELTLKEAP